MFRMEAHVIDGYPSPEEVSELQDDLDNATTELRDWENYIDAQVDLRDQHAVKALYLHGQWLGTQSSIRNQQISAISGSVQTTIIGVIASAFGQGYLVFGFLADIYNIRELYA